MKNSWVCRWVQVAVVLGASVAASCGPGEIVNDPETSEAVNESLSLAVRGCSMPRCGTVLAEWDGTAAYSNGDNTGTGVSCNGGGTYGLRYQCVELVMRHFKTKWGLRWYGNAKHLLDNAPRDQVDVYRNGDAAHPPVPGDMLVWTNGEYGHVVLITNVTETEVEAIEQNYCGSGRLRMPYSGGRIGPRRAGGPEPAGWAHAKANTARGVAPPVTMPPVPCEGSASGMSSIWTCTADRSSRQRCVSGTVQTERCAAPCQTRPTGQDDVCGAAPACGGDGQSCCAGGGCNVGLACDGGTCRTPVAPACGAEGQPCCTGNACASGLSCASGRCARTAAPVSWDCARSEYRGAQYWTCGSDGARYRCEGGVAQREACAAGCFTRATGQDDLCVEPVSGWDCARSSASGTQYWTCSSGLLYRCESGVARVVRCPRGCTSRPVGTHDVCN